jgi:hypothetical protein
MQRLLKEYKLDLTGFLNLSGLKMDYKLALMQGKSLASLASFGKAAGIWITNKDQAIRFKKEMVL